jgi:hypothetical protein
MFPLSILSLKLTIKYKVKANIPTNKRKGPTLIKNEKKKLDSGWFSILFIKNPIIMTTPAIMNVYEDIDIFALLLLFIDNAMTDNIVPTNIKPL